MTWDTALQIGVPVFAVGAASYWLSRMTRRRRAPDAFSKILPRLLVRADESAAGPVYFRRR